MPKQPAIYILSNKPQGVLYVGVTSNLIKRIQEHKQGIHDGFSHKYYCNQLVYYEYFESMNDAINREEQLKAGSRKKKIVLIESCNIDWQDLYENLI